MKDINPLHIGHIIEADLRKQALPVAWFARQIGVTRQRCYQIFHSESLGTDLLLRISRTLHRDYFALYTSTLQSQLD